MKSGVDYSEVVRVMSFDASSVREREGPLRTNRSVVTILGRALQVVCSDEWATDGNLLIGILCANGSIVDAYRARQLMSVNGHRSLVLRHFVW